MTKKLFLLLTLASVTSIIEAKPYTITEEDKACTNKAESYNELADCFNDIGNRANRHIESQLKSRNMNLYKKYYQEAKKASKACDKKYFGDGSPFAQAEANQCYMNKMIDLRVKYDKILNHR